MMRFLDQEGLVLFRNGSELSMAIFQHSQKMEESLAVVQANGQSPAILQSWLLGSIFVSYDHMEDTYYVDQVAAASGWGPILYLLAMLQVDSHGLSPHLSKVSDEANRVWERFSEYPRFQLRSRRLSADYHADDYLNRSYRISDDGLKRKVREQMNRGVTNGIKALGRDNSKNSLVLKVAENWLYERVNQGYNRWW